MKNEIKIESFGFETGARCEHPIDGPDGLEHECGRLSVTMCPECAMDLCSEHMLEHDPNTCCEGLDQEDD